MSIPLAIGIGARALVRLRGGPGEAQPAAAGRSLSDPQKAELLSEVFRVVLGVDPSRAPELYAGLLGSLIQGASLEGVYNGLVHSAEYREIERAASPAPEGVIAVFAEELEWLEARLPTRTQWGPDAARPLRVIDPAAPPQEGGESPGGPGRSYSEIFQGASVPTLRRVLGDSALRVLAAQGADAKVRADWYGDVAARLASRKVDFGLALRNRADREFHRHWAAGAGQDLLTWEVLNRYHRLLKRSAPRS